MNDSITIQPISSINGSIILPGSKSISNRVLLISSLAYGTTNIKNLLYSDDTKYMLHALKILGINFFLSNNNKDCIILGSKGILNFKNKSNLFLGNAGTVMRPLTAILSLQKNESILTGDKRMQERPINDLVDVLKQGGSNIEYLNEINYPPVHIFGGFNGGNLTIKSNISSQFLTSILIAAPLASQDTNIFITGYLTSKPYIDITLNIIKKFGVKIINNNYQNFYIPGNQKYYSPGKYYVEGDASSASYFLAAAAIKGKSIRLLGINKNSIQGDIQFVNVLKTMGAKIYYGDNFIECMKGTLQSIDLDANHIPDVAMTVAILGLFASNGVTTIRNIYNWRVKETDRLHAMATELRKIGAEIIEGKDYISITPPKRFLYAKINTYNDHRMAMCFSLIALSNQSVTIMNPNCVSKTFPNYFKEFFRVIT